MYFLRFDMRAPVTGPASNTELYRAALEMSAWGEANGCLTAMVSEHHAASDGYLPAPMIMATAIAARTSTLPITVGALLLPLYDPIKLAEDMAVLDILSGGRVSYVIGLGYREPEFAMFGVPVGERAAMMEDKLAALLTALDGEPFEYRGRSVHVTPSPASASGIPISYGGHSAAAARRAGRFGLGFFANGGDESLADIYREAALAAGHEPGDVAIPAPGSAQVLFLAEDVDQGWEQYGPYMLHDAQMYRQWEGEQRSATTSFASTVGELRAEEGAYRVVTPEQALAMIQSGAPLMMHPLVGGCPPELGWQSLTLLQEQVLPGLHSAG
jgi:alkanesulfonate monooxygenase SsuD/methylene tetrahydromethanopterin reductase-like flavin-dependent oxidoreductase (luciferase family)